MFCFPDYISVKCNNDISDNLCQLAAIVVCECFSITFVWKYYGRFSMPFFRISDLSCIHLGPFCLSPSTPIWFVQPQWVQTAATDGWCPNPEIKIQCSQGADGKGLTGSPRNGFHMNSDDLRATF
jgi:hypothetical protein